jgi:2-oxoglutarate/2-oxoacid ferredoxin oxidoreductase subunit beta
MQEVRSKESNRIGLSMQDYKGSPSTMCDGCGHDAISAQIIKACYELGVEPHTVAKLSGIGCSSKTPAYFLGTSCSFNGVHGRMPSLATGANLANRSLTILAVSGDGDSGNIGLGQFMHVIRRNVPMIYIIENNGVYGLTKGQFSATADLGSVLKSGEVNEFPPIDFCVHALELGCGFVARAFAGDPRQLVSILKAAFSYEGTALIDVLSPCVSFNNHEGSTKSYKVGRDTEVPLQEMQFVPYFEQITVDYEPGTTKEVELHDGSTVILRKLPDDYNPADRECALAAIKKAKAENHYLTGLLLLDESRKDLPTLLNLTDTPLAHLPEEKLRPSRQVLESIMNSYLSKPESFGPEPAKSESGQPEACKPGATRSESGQSEPGKSEVRIPQTESIQTSNAKAPLSDSASSSPAPFASEI